MVVKYIVKGNNGSLQWDLSLSNQNTNN